MSSKRNISFVNANIHFRRSPAEIALFFFSSPFEEQTLDVPLKSKQISRRFAQCSPAEAARQEGQMLDCQTVSDDQQAELDKMRTRCVSDVVCVCAVPAPDLRHRLQHVVGQQRQVLRTSCSGELAGVRRLFSHDGKDRETVGSSLWCFFRAVRFSDTHRNKGRIYLRSDQNSCVYVENDYFIITALVFRLCFHLFRPRPHGGAVVQRKEADCPALPKACTCTQDSKGPPGPAGPPVSTAVTHTHTVRQTQAAVSLALTRFLKDSLSVK